MDVYTMYMGSDVYASIRNPEYRDYEKFPYGTFESAVNTTNKTNNKYYRMAQEKKDQIKKSKVKDNCPFCREQKKRPLGQYLRKRQISNRDEKINEELEECDEEQEEEENETTDSITKEQHKQHHDHKHEDTGGEPKQK